MTLHDNMPIFRISPDHSLSDVVNHTDKNARSEINTHAQKKAV